MGDQIPGGVDVVDDTSTSADENVNAATRKSLTVPGNILPWIEESADAFGVPRDLLAAVVYQHSKFTGLTPSLISQVAAKISDNYDALVQTRDSSGAGRSGELASNETDRWLDAAAEFAYGTTDSGAAKAYRAEIGRVYGQDRTILNTSKAAGASKYIQHSPTGVTLGADSKLPTGKFTLAKFPGIAGGSGYGSGGGPAGSKPIIPGLSDDAATAVQRVADTLFLKYLGRFPTRDEYIDMSTKGWNPQQLETHLRAQPVKGEDGTPVPGVTLGQMSDMRGLADAYAQRIEGRDATDGEVNFMLTNGVPANDANVSAFYQQVHDHAVWHGDPTKWLAQQKQIQSIWDSLGLTGEVDANTVNAAIDGKLTQAQITDQLRSRPAPGYPTGTSVGDVERLRTLASSTKNSYFPGDAVTDAELHHLLGMSPEDVLAYYRAIVPKDSKTGLPIGIESDYRSMANSVLNKYGVVGYDVTPEDLKMFAMTKADPSTILEHFATNPAIAAAHPGLAYGMTTEQYKQATGQLGDAYAGVYPGQKLAGPRAGAGLDERNNNLLGYALGAGIGPDQFKNTLDTYREERGYNAPSAADFKERLNRPSGTSKSQGASPSTQSGAGGPTQPSGERRGEPRPAVGSRA